MTDTKTSAQSTTAEGSSKGFSKDEKAAMRERAKELKAESRRSSDRAEGQRDLLAKIAEMHDDRPVDLLVTSPSGSATIAPWRAPSKPSASRGRPRPCPTSRTRRSIRRCAARWARNGISMSCAAGRSSGRGRGCAAGGTAAGEPGSLVKLVLTVVIAASLIGLLAGVDFAGLWPRSLRPRTSACCSSACSWRHWRRCSSRSPPWGWRWQRLPFLPVLMLQYAIQFIALGAATGARVALQIRFFERLGIADGLATTMRDRRLRWLCRPDPAAAVDRRQLPAGFHDRSHRRVRRRGIQRPLPGGDGGPDPADGARPPPFGAPSPASSRRCGSGQRGPVPPERAAPPGKGGRGPRWEPGGQVVQADGHPAWRHSTRRPRCPTDPARRHSSACSRRCRSPVGSASPRPATPTA